MFKLLYKTFLISVLSGSLTTMNMMAIAQDTPPPDTSATAQMSKASATGFTRDKNGVLSKTDKVKFDNVEGSDMLASITMLATGVIAGRMAKNYRPITTDVMIAAVGGLAFIAGEVLSNMKYKKTMEDMTAEVTKKNDGTVDQAQITRLQDLRKSYEEAKDTTSTKKMLQMAAAAAFAAAAATAVYLSFQEDAMDMACTQAIATAQSGLHVCTASGATGNPEAVACGMCEVDMGIYFGEYKSNDALIKVPAPSMAKETAAKARQAMLNKPPCAAMGGTASAIGSGVFSACKAALTFKQLQEVFTSTPTKIGTNDGSKFLNEILFGGQRSVAINYEMYQSNEGNSYIDKALNLLFPKAEASWLPLLGLGAGALASFFLITGSLGVAIDTYMFVPLNRAIAFGVLGALSFLAANASQNQMDKIDENIKKIDQILADLGTLKNGVKTNIVGEQQLQLAGFQGNLNQNVPISTNPNVKTDCATSSSSSNCATLSSQVANMPGFANLPDSFKSIASQSAKLGDGLSGTNVISGSTLASANALAGKQNAIAGLLKRTQNKLNDQLAASGRPKIDFAKEQSALLNKMNGQVGKALGSRGSSPGEFLSSIGGTPLTGANSAVATKSSSAGYKSPSVATSNGSAAPVKSDKTFDLDFKEAPGELGAATAGTGGKAAEEKFDIGTNDINTDSGESIFQLISNRYIKSGYPKLLDEIPEVPVKK